LPRIIQKKSIPIKFVGLAILDKEDLLDGTALGKSLANLLLVNCRMHILQEEASQAYTEGRENDEVTSEKGAIKAYH